MTSKRFGYGVYESMKNAKAKGLLAPDVWKLIRDQVRENETKHGWRPSECAAALATYWEYLVEVFGKRATKGLLEEKSWR